MFSISTQALFRQLHTFIGLLTTLHGLRLWDESSILMVWQHKISPTFDWPVSPPAPICDVAERHLELVLVKSIKESIKP